MNGTEFKPSVQDLQQDVIELLKEVSKLMGRANFALSSEDFGQKYGDFQKQVESETRKVENLELRMAIVAPMKAGKSTIINAIIGQDLLPSRNAAMTTLPTEIFFNANLNEPILTLNDEVLSIFQDTLESLQRKINELGSEETQKRIAQYPHLNNLVQNIQSYGVSLLKPENKGREDIHKILSVLNDIVRLCSVLDPNSDPLFKLRDVPRIQTPFWHSQEGEQSNKLGNLVIVDTPGPNEAGENLRLSAVVAEQLKNSSIVLIVLDFTQLNNQAAEGVKKQVKPIIDLLGKENLYVLVNKVDQRRKGDMTTEDVKKFVASDLELSKSSDTEQVFEIAAIRAFCATKFLLELQQNPNAELTELVTVESLAQEALGNRWESKLKRSSLEELKEEADALWEDSGFAPFLDQAINALMESAAPRCMMSALNVSHSRLLKLLDDVKLRGSAITKDEEQLRLEIGALENDLHNLEKCRSRLKVVDSIITSLESNLNQIQLKKEAKVSIEDYSIEQDYKQGGAIKKPDTLAGSFLPIPEAGIFLPTNLGVGFDFFPKFFSPKTKPKTEYKSAGFFEFKTEQEAQECSEQAVAWARKRSEVIMSSVRKDAEKEVKQARINLTKILEKQTKPIIEKAKKRLNQTFEINLDLPSPTLESDDSLTTIQPDVKSQTRLRDGGYGTRTVEKRSFWHWLWIVPYEEEETYKKPDVREDYYVVSINDLVAQINDSLEARIGKINQDISEYLKEDFQERIDTFFENLDAYLGNYRDSLKQGQKDKKLSLEQQKHLIDDLHLIDQEASKKIETVNSYKGRNQQLMSTNK
ncbi:dynamin family protein [Limnoraphis robusta]|uniref:Dynamin family protein n=1 Tax=Limnoraphis robusta CCNP1315 TaxID=3110306 RepID=A0ABU5U4X2_9CYAN|nr:dynamin family protein [Limnoraphis robusta]MEA5522248.1 dynamin family protein [Limnoraphis robusta CCNP1315]MEA5545779.1 dynamin family protein [Limnoraphis robusta CCNP1324]